MLTMLPLILAMLVGLGVGCGNGSANQPASGVGGLCTGALFGEMAMPGVSLAQTPDTTDLADSLNRSLAIVADFNRDEIPDIATVIPSRGWLTVALGKGDGTFASRRDYTVGRGLVGIAAADLNGDGALELITADKNDSVVSILIGKGDGSFVAGNVYPVDTPPRALAIGDWTSDGKVDVIAGEALFAGNGDGTLARSVGLGVSPNSLAVGDLNRDGRLDLVAHTTVNMFGYVGLQILLGRGDGSFSRGGIITASASTDVVLGDLDGDGTLDLVYRENCNAKGPASYTYVFTGVGDGTFSAKTRFEQCGNEIAGASLKLGDLNGDGHADILAESLVWLSTPAGTYQRSVNSKAINAWALGLADYNRDGKLDLAVVDTTFRLEVLLGHGDGSLGNLPTYPAESELGASTLADFDGDGRPDLYTYDYFQGRIRYGRSDGSGSFGSPVDVPYEPSVRPVEDVNGDGRPELVTFDQRQLTLRLSTGHRTHDAGRAFATGVGPANFAASDVNRDGHRDLVVVNSGGNMGEDEPVSVTVLLNKGDGTLQDQVRFDTALAFLSGSVMADLDHDGTLDVAVATEKPSYALTVFLGRPDGTFVQTATNPLSQPANFLGAADLNRDGKPDLVVGGDDGVTVQLGQGDGRFGTPVTLAVGLANAWQFALVDFNHDGVLDLGVSGNGIVVLLGRGDGTFACAETYATDLWANFLFGDLNHDGKTDVVAMEQGVFAVLLGR